MKKSIAYLIISLTLFLSSCVESVSSFQASEAIKELYPKCELRQSNKDGIVRFYVRTEDNGLYSIQFNVRGEMLSPEEIFPPKK